MNSASLEYAIAEEVYAWQMENTTEEDELWKPFDRLPYTEKDKYLDIASRIIEVYEDALEEVEEI
jgi:hypothetical protein